MVLNDIATFLRACRGTEPAEIFAQHAATLDALATSVAALDRRWREAELQMRVLHGGLPGTGYDKLADGYGACADELAACLTAGVGDADGR